MKKIKLDISQREIRLFHLTSKAAYIPLAVDIFVRFFFEYRHLASKRAHTVIPIVL
jgi:hypothetical protein